MAEETLTITDNRTGRRYQVPIRDGAIAAADLQKITSDGSGSGLLSYDPAFLNTASCRSAITFIDGERSILRYRGYPVEELAERSSFLEVAYLLIHGELPDPIQHREWVQAITHHTLLHENIKKLIDGFHHDAHPMGILVGTVGALSTFYPDAKDIFNVESRRVQILRLIAKMPTLAAYGARHGGANEQVLRMLKEIGSVSRVPEYVKRVRTGELRMMGFGHRVYKNFDPRAQIIKKVADDVLAVTGRSPLLDIALELERVALADDYFIKHRLYPNVDFYSGIIYSAIGFPVEMFPVLFAIGRTPGWLAQWQEGLLDPEQKIMRPRQVYTGPAERHLPGVRAAKEAAGTSAG